MELVEARATLRRFQDEIHVARREAAQILAGAREEADLALDEAAKIVRDARAQAERITSDARREAEQIAAEAAEKYEAVTGAFVSHGDPQPQRVFVSHGEYLEGMLLHLMRQKLVVGTGDSRRRRTFPLASGLKEKLITRFAGSSDGRPHVIIAACGDTEPEDVQPRGVPGTSSGGARWITIVVSHADYLQWEDVQFPAGRSNGKLKPSVGDLVEKGLHPFAAQLWDLPGYNRVIVTPWDLPGYNRVVATPSMADDLCVLSPPGADTRAIPQAAELMEDPRS